VAGPITAADGVTINDHGALAISSAITAGSGVVLTADQSISQSAGTITTGGLGGVSMTAMGGAIMQSAGAVITSAASGSPITLSAANGISFGGRIGGNAPVVTLNAGAGPITETVGGANTGVLTAGLLTGQAGGSVLLDNAANSIADLGTFSSGGNFVLVDRSALRISGNIAAASGLMIAGYDAITQDSGAIQTSAGNVNIAAAATYNQGTGALVAATAPNGSVTIEGGSGISIGGTVAATGSTSVVALNAPGGSITETATGHVDATRLTISAGANATLSNAYGGGNLIATLGSASAAGMLALADTGDLNVAGPVIGGSGVSLGSTGNMILAPNTRISASAGPVSLAAGNSLTQGNGGLISGNTLTITAPGAVTLAGSLSGNKIVVSGPGDSPAGSVTLLPGVVIATGSAGSFLHTQAFATLPTRANGTAGAYFYTANFVESGGFTVTGLGNSTASTLRIDSVGDVAFDLTNGLNGPGTTLIMDVLGTGTVTGNVAMKGLFVGYPEGITASMDLSGSVDGMTGDAAAQAAAIAPQQNTHFRFNSCAIASVNCIVIPVQSVPPMNAAQDLNIGNFRDSDDDSDLLLPNVSDKDY
jgi:hypothetical protein